MPVDDLTDAELQNRHDDLLRLQKQDLDAGYSEGARELARERNRLWNEAQARGITL